MLQKGFKLYSRKRQLFHFGDTNLDDTIYTFSSDSLYSALVFSYLHKEHDLDKKNKLYQEFENNLRALSSLYFGIKHDDFETFFLPMPKNFMISQTLFEEDSKFLKKCFFISKGVMDLWNNWGSDAISKKNIKKIQNGLCVVTQNEFEKLNLRLDDKLFFNVVEDKVQLVDEEDNELYKVESFMLNPYLNMFFYFLIDASSYEIIKQSLSQLCISYGLGGDISVGKGSIESFEEFEVEFNENDNSFENVLCLGKYVPEVEDLSFLDNSDYSLSSRKGYVFANSHKRRDCFCFDEGSVFPKIIDEGTILDVTPESYNKHRVFKFFKPIKLEINTEDEK